MRYLNNTLDHFWKRWRTEYLTELRETHRQTKKVPKQVIAIGDIGLIQAVNSTLQTLKRILQSNQKMNVRSELEGLQLKMQQKKFWLILWTSYY